MGENETAAKFFLAKIETSNLLHMPSHTKILKVRKYQTIVFNKNLEKNSLENSARTKCPPHTVIIGLNKLGLSWAKLSTAGVELG